MRQIIGHGRVFGRSIPIWALPTRIQRPGVVVDGGEEHLVNAEADAEHDQALAGPRRQPPRGVAVPAASRTMIPPIAARTDQQMVRRRLVSQPNRVGN